MYEGLLWTIERVVEDRGSRVLVRAKGERMQRMRLSGEYEKRVRGEWGFAVRRRVGNKGVQVG